MRSSSLIAAIAAIASTAGIAASTRATAPGGAGARSQSVNRRAPGAHKAANRAAMKLRRKRAHKARK